MDINFINPPQKTLDEVKQDKINELTNINNSYVTFTSSALGTVHTYLIDAGKINAEYSYVNSTAYDGSPILWYTVEEGGVNHTKDQFNQVWLDGRNFEITNFANWDKKVKQVKAVTTDTQTLADAAKQINSITW